MGHFVAYRQTQKFFSVFWFDSFNTTDCHFCRCRISPVWFSSDIQRSNPRTREGWKILTIACKNIYDAAKCPHGAPNKSHWLCAAGKGDPRSLQRSPHTFIAITAAEQWNSSTENITAKSIRKCSPCPRAHRQSGEKHFLKWIKPSPKKAK